MLYVQRKNGVIIGLFANPQPQPDGSMLTEPTPLPEDNPEVVAFLAPKPPIDMSNVDNLEKTLKALALVMRDYCNALKAGTYANKTVADLKSDFSTKYNQLP